MDESREPRPGDRESGIPLSPPVLLKVTGRELEKRAAQLGTVAGKAVAVFREARRQWQQASQGSGEDCFAGLGATAKAKRVAEILRHQSAARSEQWRRTAHAKTADLRRQARSGYEQARARAQQVGRDYPTQVVIAAAVAGFLLGAGLRIWRSKRAA